jgi:hypothetical protein
MKNPLRISVFAALLVSVIAGCTANVENPTVDQTGKNVDMACVTKCNDSDTTCVAKCTDDSCKASCKTDLDKCTSTCTTTTTSSAGSGA